VIVDGIGAGSADVADDLVGGVGDVNGGQLARP
jgi:hypothetical protein